MKSTNINAIKIIRSLRRRMLDTLNSSFKTYYRCPCNKTMIPNNSKQFQSTGSHLDVPATSDIFTPQVHKPDSNTELAVSTNARTEEKLETVLEEIGETALDNVLEAITEESPINRWMEIASPILKSGGKAVAVILALGFVSIPLMVSGSSWVALILAIGASVTAIVSCL